MGFKKRFNLVLDFVIYLGMILASLGALIYMFAKDLASPGLLFLFCVTLYLGLKGMFGDRLTRKRDTL